MSLAINTTVVRSENGKLLLEEQAGHVKLDVLSPNLSYGASVEVEAHNDRGHVHIRGADEIQITQNDNGNSLSSLQLVDGSMTFNADQIQLSCINAPIEMNINGTPGAGKVLTCSDSIGTCDWQTPGGGGDVLVVQTKISVTSAQLKAIFATPLLLITIPANTRFDGLVASSRYNAGATGYIEYDTNLNTTYYVTYTTAFSNDNYIYGIINELNLTVSDFKSQTISGSVLHSGEDIYLISNGQDLTASAGDGTLDIWLTYSLMAL